MDTPKDGDPLTDHLLEQEDITNTFTSLIYAIGPPKNRSSLTMFMKKLDDVPEISLPLTLPR